MGIEWIIIAILGGGAAGAGITGLVMRDKGGDEAITVQQEVVRELSKLDILEPLCAEDYIGAHGDGLCREMYCWAQTNSTTGEANGVACEAISNINNTVAIRAVCEAVEDETEKAGCYTLFRERK